MAIYSSTEHLLVRGPNSSFGNHVLHLYALEYFRSKLNIPFKISCDSNLDEVFLLDPFKDYKQPKVLYEEQWGGDVLSYYNKDLYNINCIDALILKPEEYILQDFQIKGWFWDSKYLPSSCFFDTVRIRPELSKFVAETKPWLFDPHTVVLHYRGTDFKHHDIGWGDLRLKSEYYLKCIEHFKSLSPIHNLVVVSDDPTDIVDVLSATKANVIIEKNNYTVDWLILLLCKNLICSNSSFCYTAGWYNKRSVYQPSKFFTRYMSTELHYPLNPYYKDSVVL